MKILKIKNLLLGLVAILTATVLITSCGEENLNVEGEFEISEKVNQVREYESEDVFFDDNPDITTDITYEDYIQLHVTVQKVVYRNMSNEKRLSLWKEKFRRDLMNDDLPGDVRTIMNKFVSEITKEKFESKTDITSFSNYLEQLDEKSQKYFIQFPSNNSNTAALLKSGDCITNEYCSLCHFMNTGMPSGYYADCIRICNYTSSGCGFFLWYPCDYTCKTVPTWGGVGGSEGPIPTGN